MESSSRPLDGPTLKKAITDMQNIGFIEYAAYLIYCHELKRLGFSADPLWSKLKDEQKQQYLRIADKQFVAWQESEIDALQNQLEKHEYWVRQGLDT